MKTMTMILEDDDSESCCGGHPGVEVAGFEFPRVHWQLTAGHAVNSSGDSDDVDVQNWTKYEAYYHRLLILDVTFEDRMRQAEEEEARKYVEFTEGAGSKKKDGVPAGLNSGRGGGGGGGGGGGEQPRATPAMNPRVLEFASPPPPHQQAKAPSATYGDIDGMIDDTTTWTVRVDDSNDDASRQNAANEKFERRAKELQDWDDAEDRFNLRNSVAIHFRDTAPAEHVSLDEFSSASSNHLS